MPLDETAAALLLNPADDVAVARRRIAKGEPTGLSGVMANQLIPRGHKVALRAVRAGAALRSQGSAGVAYRSVRHPGGQCVGLFKPRGAPHCLHAAYLLYIWDGTGFSGIYQQTD